ncbi:hypothetical protein HDV01_004318 [Terramyces sp. JEL0728]|nr:hypothetical protein HDV01_004318 [Terramyces sp. JEL0728]
MANGDWIRIRKLTALYDLIERLRLWFTGCQVERIVRKMISNKDILPSVSSEDWEERVVVFWAHGGGFGSGSAYSFITGHAQIMNQYNRLKSANSKPLLYFCSQYPLAPEVKYSQQLDSVYVAYLWLVQHVGVRNIIIGGDSAGANLMLSLHQMLVKQQSANPHLILPKSVIIISPWLDLSLSHTPPHILDSLSATSDYLPYTMLEVWRDNTIPHSMHPRDPRMSPFFDLSPIVMPEDGMLLIYGSTEIFAPEIDDWVKSIRKQKDVRAKLKIILGVDMPHDFPLALHNVPSSAHGKANRALFEMARFIFQSAAQ